MFSYVFLQTQKLRKVLHLIFYVSLVFSDLKISCGHVICDTLYKIDYLYITNESRKIDYINRLSKANNVQRGTATCGHTNNQLFIHVKTFIQSLCYTFSVFYRMFLVRREFIIVHNLLLIVELSFFFQNNIKQSNCYMVSMISIVPSRTQWTSNSCNRVWLSSGSERPEYLHQHQ